MNKVVIDMNKVNTILGLVLVFVILFNIGIISYRHETKKIFNQKVTYATEKTAECAAYLMTSLTKEEK